MPKNKAMSEWDPIPYHIKKVWQPNGYDQETLKHDIALAVVREDFQFNDYVKPIVMDLSSWKVKRK